MAAAADVAEDVTRNTQQQAGATSRRAVWCPMLPACVERPRLRCAASGLAQCCAGTADKRTFTHFCVSCRLGVAAGTGVQAARGGRARPVRTCGRGGQRRAAVLGGAGGGGGAGAGPAAGCQPSARSGGAAQAASGGGFEAPARRTGCVGHGRVAPRWGVGVRAGAWAAAGCRLPGDEQRSKSDGSGARPPLAVFTATPLPCVLPQPSRWPTLVVRGRWSCRPPSRRRQRRAASPRRPSTSARRSRWRTSAGLLQWRPRAGGCSTIGS